MNSEEVIVLLRQSIKHYLDPVSIRPSETRTDASVRQLAGIRENFEELRRYMFVSTTTGGAAAASVGSQHQKPPPPIPQSNAFHEQCLTLAQMFIDQRQFREALNTCLAAYQDSRAALDVFAEEEAARLERGGKMAALLQEETTTTTAAPLAPAAEDIEESGRKGKKKASSAGSTEDQLAMVQVHRHRAVLLTKLCVFFLTLEADPHMEGATTTKDLEATVDVIIAEMQRMISKESLYFLVYNATLIVFQCCQELIRLSCFRLAAPYLAYCGRVMDAMLPLATVKFLPWRLRLYSAVCLCYEALQETKGALRIAQHALRVTENLFELEMSDVVPPPQKSQDILNACVLEARLLAQRLQLRDSASALVASNAAASAAASAAATEGSPAAAGKPAKTAQGKGANAAAPVSGTSSQGGSIPASTTELLDSIRSTIRGSSAGTPTAAAVTVKSLDVLCAIAVDYNSRWLAIPSAAYDNVQLTTSADKDAILSEADPLKVLAAEGVVQQILPMAEAYFRKNLDVARTLGWGKLYEEPPRPTTADGADAAVSATAAGGKKAPPAKAAGKKAPVAAPPSPSGSSKLSPGMGSGVGDAAPTTAIDEFIIQNVIPPTTLCGWVRAAFTAHLDVASYDQASRVKDSLLLPSDLGNMSNANLPSSFNKVLAALLEVVRSAPYASQFPDPHAGLHRSVLLPNAQCSAAAVELNLVQQLSNVKCAVFDLQQRRRANTDDSSSTAPVEALRAACAILADTIVIALREDVLVSTKSDLLEDAARILLAAWADIPFPHEAKNAAEVYAACAYALMATQFPDVLTTGNCALTASRLLQEQQRDGEALALVRPVEEFLAGRQAEFVFNHNAWGATRGEDEGAHIFGETLRRDKAATLDKSLWLKTIRDIRTHLVQHLAALRLSVAASKQYDADVLEHSRKVGVMKTRDDQSHIFGALSRKEKRVMTLMETAAMEAPTTAEAMERKLCAWAGTDAVHAALVWIEISKRQSDPQAKKDKLKKASEFLQQAQFSYDATLKALIYEDQQRREAASAAALGRGRGGITIVGGAGGGGAIGDTATVSGGAPTRPGTAPSEFALGSALNGVHGGNAPMQSVPQSNLVTPRLNSNAAAPKVTPGGHSSMPLLSPRGKAKSQSQVSPSTQSASVHDDAAAQQAFTAADITLEATSATGLSIFLVWSLFGEACSLVEALDICRQSKLESVLFARFVICGDSDAKVWNKNPFAVDALNRAVCNTSSTYLTTALGKALGVIAAAHALDTPYTPDGAMEDDEEDGLDKRRLDLRNVQRNFARCGNTAILGLELSASADDQASMALLSNQVFNYTLPLLISKNPSVVALRPITTIFHVMMLFDKRRWSDGPLQYLAARTIRGALSIAKTLSPAAQRPVINAALSCFSHVWPLVLQHPNVRQRRHMDTVVSHIQYVDRVMHAKFRKPVDATATPADVPVKGGKGAAAKGGAAGGAAAAKGAAAAAAAAQDGSNAADASLYFRTELFFDDFMPMEYLELLDEIVMRIPGGVALCEQLESKYVPPAAVVGTTTATSPTPTNVLAASANRPATGGAGGPGQADEAPRRGVTVQRSAKTLFPPLLLQVAAMLATSVHPTAIVAKIQDAKATDPFFSKVCASVALELISRRQDEFAAQLCTEGIKEILKRHDKLSALQKESLKTLRDSLTALGHYSSPASANGGESATQVASMEERLMQKMSRRISEIRRRFAFKRLRSWFMQYDLPFQGLLNMMLSICSQHEAEREKAKLALLGSQGVTPQSAQPPPVAVAAASPAAKPQPPAAVGKKGGPAVEQVGAALHGGMTPEDRFQQAKEDAVKFAVKAAVLLNRCYRVQYTYVAVQLYVNAMRSLFATEPPSSLTDVLQQQRVAEQGGGVSSRSAASNVPGQQAFHLTLHSANTKPIIDSISKVETPCKVMANEIIKFLKHFQDGYANASKEVESLQPVCVKTGEDCLPERGGVIRRTTSLQMWLTEEGQFEERRRDVQDTERRSVRDRIYERERSELQEVENWERLVVFKAWVKEFLELSKGEGSSDDSALVDSLYLQFRALTGTAPSSRQSNTTEGSQRLGTGVSGAGGDRGRSTSPIPPALMKSNRKAAAKKKIQLQQKQSTTPAPTADDAPQQQQQHDDVGYQTIDFEPKLGKTISLNEIIRCFSYVVRCLQYGQRKQSAVAMTLEINDITKNHYAPLLLPYALNLQSAMGQNTEKIMLKYITGHREMVRTKKLIQEAHRVLAVYKESDAYRRAQLKLANTLQPSRRGIVVPQDAEVVSVATSATGGGACGAGAGAAYKEVVTAFQNAISYLRQKHSTLLLVGVLYELGHLHLHHRVRAEAERSWNDVVDAAFSAVNALKNWRTILDGSNDSVATTFAVAGEEEELLHRIGLHKGIMSAAALSALAMYSYGENQKKATEACIMAAEVLRAIVGAGNIGAPQRPWDHGRFTANELFVNVELSETYSEFMPNIVNGFLYAAQHLIDFGYPQHSTYVANVAEYLALHSLRSKDAVVYARLLKAKAAGAATNFRAAIETLHAIATGKNLPDASGGTIGVLVDVADADAKGRFDAAAGAGTATGAKKDAKTAPAKGKAADEAAALAAASGGAESSAILPTPAGPISYDNSKPPTDPDNLKAVEGALLAMFPALAQAVAASTTQPTPALLTFLAPSMVGLAECVAVEYGPVLTRQVLATVSHVMLSLSACDVAASWQAAADAQSAADAAATAAAAGGKSKGQDKKDIKGGAAATQAQVQAPGGPSSVALALKAADVIAAALLQSVAVNGGTNSGGSAAAGAAAPATTNAAAAAGAKSKDTAAAAALAAASAAAAPTSITANCSAVEQSYWEHQSAWMQAVGAALQGQHKHAATLLKACIDAHNTKDSYTLSVPHAPSFSMSTTGRFLCDVYCLLGKCLVWMREFPRAEEAAAAGSLIADHCGDSYAQREFAILRMSCATRRGDGMTALEDIDIVTKQCKALSFRGIDGFFPSSVVNGHILHHSIVDDPRLHQLNVLLPMYDAAVNHRTREALRVAAAQLTRRAEDLGLNVVVDSTIHPTVVNAQTTAVYELHHNLNHLAELQVRCNLLDEAIDALRSALAVAAHYDIQRMPHEISQTKLQLAVALRLKQFPDDAKSGMAIVCSVPNDRPLSNSAIPTTDEELTVFFQSGHHPHVREIVKLLRSVVHDTIATGTHDYELLRSAFVNLAFITARFPQLALVTVNLTALAGAVSTMQSAVTNNTSTFAAPAATPENPTAALGVTDLPPAVIALLEDVVRRDTANQKLYADNALSFWQHYVNSAAAVSAATAAVSGKGGAPGNSAVAAQPPTSTVVPPLTVTLPVIASTFVLAHNERSTSMLNSQRPIIDSLLVTLRGFLQSKVLPFTIASMPDPTVSTAAAGGSSASSAVPWLLFAQPPRLAVASNSAPPSAVSGTPAQSWFPKANYVFTQNFVSSVSTPTYQEVEGELKATIPFVTMLLAVSALADASAVQQTSQAAAAPQAKGASGAAAAKGGAATSSATAQVLPAAAQSDDTSAFPATPIVLAIPCIPQKALTALHHKANTILRQHTLHAETSVQLDEVLQEAMVAAGGGGGAGAGATGAKKGAAPPAASSLAFDASATGAPAGNATGMTPRLAPRHSGPSDEDISDVLLGFIELLVTAACGESAPKHRDAFYPSGAVTMEHILFIAHVTNVDGGWSSLSHLQVHEWALTLGRELIRCITRGDGKH